MGVGIKPVSKPGTERLVRAGKHEQRRLPRTRRGLIGRQLPSELHTIGHPQRPSEPLQPFALGPVPNDHVTEIGVPRPQPREGGDLCRWQSGKHLQGQGDILFGGHGAP